MSDTSVLVLFITLLLFSSCPDFYFSLILPDCSMQYRKTEQFKHLEHKLDELTLGKKDSYFNANCKMSWGRCNSGKS